MSRRRTLARALGHGPMRRALITYALVSIIEFAVYFAVILVAFDSGGGGLAGMAAAAQRAPGGTARAARSGG